MKIVHLNYSSNRGGAAQAMLRLDAALRENGVISSICSLERGSNNFRIATPQREIASIYLNGLIQSNFVNACRTSLSDTIFTLPSPGYDLRSIAKIRQADVINLHWINYFVSPSDIRELYLLGKPIVWTVHDEWPYTGGCHYTSGCKRYLEECSSCPQLVEASQCISQSVLEQKKRLWNDIPFSIVGPSKWILDRARSSKLFESSNFHLIPNSVDTDVFAPSESGDIRSKYDIASSTFVILFGADSVGEKRKGFKILIDAIERALKVRNATEIDVHLLCFGNLEPEQSFSTEFTSMGYLDCEEDVVKAYQASDLFVLPSLEDNLPNTMLESMACGTPLLAFDTGGVVDVITDGVNGYIAREKNAISLARRLLYIFKNRIELHGIGIEARKTILEKYSFDVQASRYIDLYRTLIVDDELERFPAFSPPDDIAWASGLDSGLLRNRGFRRLCCEALSVIDEVNVDIKSEFTRSAEEEILKQIISRSEAEGVRRFKDCSIADFNQITFLGGFKPFEGPYPEYNLPQFMWCYAPKADISIRSKIKEKATLNLCMQSRFVGCLHIENNECEFGRFEFSPNFANSDGHITKIELNLDLEEGENYIRFIFVGDFEDSIEVAIFTNVSIC